MMREKTTVWSNGTNARSPRAGAPRGRELQGDIEVDVAIIGAGITGLTAALRLAEDARLRIALLEARPFCGVTSLSTGHLTQWVDAGYAALEKSFGREANRLVAEGLGEAIDFIGHASEAMQRAFGVDAAYARRTGWFFAEAGREGGRDDGELREELEAAARAGLPVRFEREAPLPFATAGAVALPGQAQIDPDAYVLGLAASLPETVAFYTNAFVHAVHGGEPCRVETSRGTVKARWVVEATHVPLGRNIYHAVTAPYRSYVIAAKVDAPLPEGLFWDTASPYHYLREHRGVLIVGGADHKTGQADDTVARYCDLEEYTQRRFGPVSVRARWTAEVYESVDGLPYMGKAPWSHHVIVSTGYAGDGLVFGTLGGMLACDLVMGRAPRWAPVLSASRVKPVASAAKLVKEQANVALRLVGDRLKRVPKGAFDRVPQGEGRLVMVDGKRCAVYRDERGHVHVMSATCTHAACVVQWNAAAKTWDCPCHGGCFAPTGEVIAGPPPRRLAPYNYEHEAPDERDAEPLRPPQSARGGR
jgi:glycine/D-amino acid oxidase-like deaminating enzyme/nitrite reductase/ring-hydroxylating ferredoxin subunit